MIAVISLLKRLSCINMVDIIIIIIWKETSASTNILYDQYKTTKDVLKSFHPRQEERLRDHLFSQGSFFRSMSEHSLTTLNSLWSSAQSSLPKNIFNFSIKYIKNTLPTKTNLKRWGLSPSSDCSFCLTQESLLHIVSGCKVYLQQGRYTWRHDSILMLIATTFRSLQHAKLFADIPGFLSTSVITGDDLRPDLLLSLSNKSLYILELTVGYKSNLGNNAERKKQKYWELTQQLKNDYDKINFVNLSISALGMYDKSTTDFIDMMKTLKIDKRSTNYMIKKITSIAIRTSYYIFCRR